MRTSVLFSVSVALSVLAAAPAYAQSQTTLSITKTVSEQSTVPGAHLHYSITVRNTGNSTAMQAYFDDYIHPNMFVQQLDAACGLVLFPNGSEGVRCFVDDIAPGQSVTKNLVFRTGNTYQCNNGSEAKNTAGAWAQNAAGVTTPLITTPVTCNGTTYSSSSSSWPSNSSTSSYFSCQYYPWLCSSSSSFGGARTQLSIEKSVSERETRPGGELHYRITVRNTGNAAAEGVVVEDFVHPGMIADDVGSQCTKLGETLVRCNVGTLQPGQSATGEMRFRTSRDYECGNGSVARNSAAASAQNANGVTTALIVTPVTCDGGGEHAGNLRLDKRVLRTEVFPGETIEYEIRVRNETNRDLTDVVVHDRFDDRDLQIVDDGDADAEDEGSLVWNLGTLRGGEEEIIRYRLRLRHEVRPGDRVRNDAEVHSRDGEAGDDSVTVNVIGSLPQTGFFSGTKSVSLMSKNTTRDDDDSPLAALLSLAMAGVAGGSFLGRRYFL
jgi:uncharacterized repeat protein (TIGR01451 family)